MLIGDEKYVTSGGLRLWAERFGDRDDPGVLLIMGTSAQGNNAGPAWARAMAGQPAEPDELPPPAPRFLRHVMASAQEPRPARAVPR